MIPLFEMMSKAQNGNAIGEMAKQFGLAQEQTMKAMSALMPAFSAGLNRSAANPYDFSALLAAAASGNYSQYFEDVSKAFTPQGIAAGNDILSKIFGSKEVSRAVAAQAEQMSGIGQDIYKQMMPVVANAMVGGFFKQMAGQMQAAGEAIAAGKPADFVTQWMQATGLAEKPKDPVFDNPFAQSMQAFFGQGGKSPSMADLSAQNPFLQMYESMMKAAVPGQQPPAASAENEKAKQQDPASAYSGLLSQMFDAGVEVQKNYQKSMDGIFDSYFANLKGGEKKQP